jgi:hypothetical protein
VLSLAGLLLCMEICDVILIHEREFLIGSSRSHEQGAGARPHLRVVLSHAP